MRQFRKTVWQTARRKRQGRFGATAVEFAMVAPIFGLAIIGCIEFSRISMMRNLAQNASYEAARFAMQEGAEPSDAIDKANQILRRLGTKSATVTPTFIPLLDDDGNVVQGADRDRIRVDISIPLTENVFLLGYLFTDEHALTATTTLRTERYRGFFDGQD